ncbi:LacI family DNA-binding transcriptional regulator [Robertmurraya kyonggiensis]|uniref:LacI family transcriptional regulator n=1 Tax=Robertmurraya kyonggiensis TaxID=1037680 RepID=A0A4U1D6V2_9BACI|nr:LacI family DNA-binding transcriptional regulator [Robertmurraya kyonggiensis]TKC16806.1 LacI family transcriptional regulator [Robertmurraya kyonggiensis]
MSRKKVTIRDIARESGVSVATVSRYLNKNSYTSPETEKKIQKVMERFQYTPNAIARGLAKQKSNTIAFVTPDITNPFFPELVNSIEKVAKAKGYSLLLINTNEQELQNLDFWNHFQSKYIDGFIMAESELNEKARRYLDEMEIPFVRIDRAVHPEHSNSVHVDNFEGARLAVRHLLEIGCKKVAHISGPNSLYPAQERLMGYQNVISNTKMTSIVLEGDFTLESGTAQTEKLLQEHPDVDGIFYANDLMAIGALKAFRAHQKSVPEDIAIMGFDGIRLTEIVHPEISTIKQPIDKIGETATNQLIHFIENPDEVCGENVLLKVELVERESTRR